MKSIRIVIEQQPELYDELIEAMMTHSQYQGCYVVQYSETREGGQTVARFILRESGANQTG
jgi:hypothetical protein